LFDQVITPSAGEVMPRNCAIAAGFDSGAAWMTSVRVDQSAGIDFHCGDVPP
jgi:hypothetical protein